MISARELSAPRYGSYGWWVFIVTLITLGYFFQGGQDNENARFAQVRSIVEDGEISSGRFAGRSADVVEVNGQIFPNKAPGLTLVSLGPWKFFAKLANLFSADVAVRENFAVYFTTVVTVSFASALLAWLIFLVAREVCRSEIDGMLIAFAVALGTIALPFGGLYFSHQLSAAFSFLSFCLLYFSEPLAVDELLISRSVLRKWCEKYPTLARFLAGMILGWAVATEYPLAIFGPFLGLYLLRSRDWKGVVVFICGGLFGTAPLFAYNLWAFGKLWFVPYSVYAQGGEHSAFPEHARGFMGVSLPALGPLWEITFGLRRGIFVINPWLLLLFPSAVGILVSRTFRTALNCLCLGVVCAFFAFNSAYGESIVFWGGGASVGPRHVIPMLPFAGLLIAPLLRCRVASFQLWRNLFLPLVLFSVAVMIMAIATEPRVGYEYQNPLLDLFWYQYRNGNFGIYFSGVFSAVQMTESSVSFNLGKLLGLPGPVQLLPLFCVLALAYYSIRGNLGEKGLREKLLFGCGVLIALVPVAHNFLYQLSGHFEEGLFGYESFGEAQVQPFPPSKAELGPFPAGAVARYDRTIVSPGSVPDEIQGAVTFEWRGQVYIPEGGEVVFATMSDDGSVLYIDGEVAVDNSGVHYLMREERLLTLRQGYHPITLRYSNEASGGGGLILLWSKMGQHFHPIPPQFLTPIRPPE